MDTPAPPGTARGQRILVTLNFDDHPHDLDHPEIGTGRILLSTHDHPQPGSLHPLRLAPYEGVIASLTWRLRYRSWLRPTGDVLAPLEKALFSKRWLASGVPASDPRYRRAVFYLLACETSC